MTDVPTDEESTMEALISEAPHDSVSNSLTSASNSTNYADNAPIALEDPARRVISCLTETEE
jgi:hypothetical protein